MDIPTRQHADRILRNMELTRENIVRTQGCIADCADKSLKIRLRLKNERRVQALESMERHLNGGARPLS